MIFLEQYALIARAILLAFEKFARAYLFLIALEIMWLVIVSTIQAVIGRVISKSAEREAQGRFEITSTITPRIVRHEVQLLVNHNYNKIREEYDSGLNYLTGLYIQLLS